MYAQKRLIEDLNTRHLTNNGLESHHGRYHFYGLTKNCTERNQPIPAIQALCKIGEESVVYENAVNTGRVAPVQPRGANPGSRRARVSSARQHRAERFASVHMQREAESLADFLPPSIQYPAGAPGMNWNLRQLKAACREVGLSRQGNKPELLRRLYEHFGMQPPEAAFPVGRAPSAPVPPADTVGLAVPAPPEVAPPGVTAPQEPRTRQAGVSEGRSRAEAIAISSDDELEVSLSGAVERALAPVRVVLQNCVSCSGELRTWNEIRVSEFCLHFWHENFAPYTCILADRGECSICTEDQVDLVTLPCGQTVCEACLLRVCAPIATQSSQVRRTDHFGVCPFCRGPLPPFRPPILAHTPLLFANEIFQYWRSDRYVFSQENSNEAFQAAASTLGSPPEAIVDPATSGTTVSSH
jgi:hypothetical protein